MFLKFYLTFGEKLVILNVNQILKYCFTIQEVSTMSTTISTKKIAVCAMFAALTAICSQIAIPIPPIPINLALFAVHLSGALLGAKFGLFSQLAFVLLGAFGLPVFQGFSGGMGIITGPTGGYIVGYLVAAFLVGLICERWGRSFRKLCIAMVIGVAACYAFGTVWFMMLTGKGLVAALGMCVLPFLPGDALKILGAAWLVQGLRKPLAASGWDLAN